MQPQFQFLRLVYEQPYHPSQYPQGRPDSRDTGRRQDYQSSARVSQVYGWKPAVFEQPSYGAYPGPANAYPGQDPTSVPVPVPFGRTTPGPSGLGKQQQQPQGYSDPNVSSPYGPISAPLPSTTTIPQQQQHIQAGYGTVGQGGYGHQPNVPYSQQGPMPYPIAQQPVQQQSQQQSPTSQQPTQTPAIQQQPIQTAVIQPQPVQAQVIQQQPVQVQPVQQSTQTQPAQQPTQAQPVQQPTQPQPVQQPTQTQPVQRLSQAQPVQQQLESAQQPSFSQHNSFEHEQPRQQLLIQAQPETDQAHSQPQAQVQASSGASSISPQRQTQPQPQAQAQPQQQQQQQPAGPPYIYDPTTTYADPNVQAWAQYYAQGGRDLAGSVYFISIPGLTDKHAPGSTQQTEAQRGQQAQQGRQDQQQHAANGTSGRRSLEGYNTSVKQQQPQPYQTQPQPSDTELSYATTAATHQEQPSQLHEPQFTQLSQYQPQHVQDQILPQPLSQQQPSQQSLHEYDYLGQNPYLQQQQSSSVPDVGFKPSSPTRSLSFGLGPGDNRLSSGSIQAGIAAATTGSTSATPSWVLPKKTPPATVAGNPADMGGLPGQFRKISLSGTSGPFRKISLSGSGAAGSPNHSPVDQGA
jgi:signal transducing adaptor molecule